ncbi:putative diphosphate--fructose-6-phosphate 1-phosphotransferase [Helianthus annuus]|uniref:Pyrophosphate--fructose 6-phosphate 1-phosphotransferase subunit alpha n=1 Tax=Helianthus annuus TaxID=4232 RepID=A0A251SDA4_HELAN|nr:pyrophosphate--fructose 6-phosphate 1-phosphotransferase subunit alpha [Helianthus annuus]KAF5767081.1 putative diphosphate--fructose-6-phosphate 1-phosphotransferase [Helianthus annuus]KAJ0462713.1 putative diphosphate--fructose-6-phosphate 1-phosphotransferase [Helianthus annuus]KAJ0484039.1 putative diphosphate--fructose-6-phosphate 1-phosphotransferase [Helianthus annuus]
MESDYGVPRDLSALQKSRSIYHPELPPCLQGTTVRVEFGDATTVADSAGAHAISQSFPHTYGQRLVHFLRATAKVHGAQIISDLPAMRVGVVFCGRQSPGGHNVVWGLHEALKIHNPKSILLGFLGGSEGLFAQRTLEITDNILSTYKNQGGYDLLGRTKDQIRTQEQVNAAMAACNALKLDGLVIIGGVTSNTDAAQLAETFAEAKCSTKVVGVPVTLNGDLRNKFVEANVGFDTICKVNSQLISNVCTDALSAEKYYYFIRLMGRKASHVALECTLQSHPNMVILAEEVAASNLTIFDLTKQICDAIQARAEQEKYHGVILLPEGLIESIPEVYALLQEIHSLLRRGVSVDKISTQLSPWASALFEFLPPFIRKQLLLYPESDDSAQLSQIEIEKLLAELVEAEMNKRQKEGSYKGKKFNAICHFFGYQARGSLPSKFDCDYAYVLGHICYHILAAGLNGYMATVTNLKNPSNKWRCGAAPITAMLSIKHDGRAMTIGKPLVHPATVDLRGKVYELLRQNARKLLLDDIYRNPGPLQFEGPGVESRVVSLCVEDLDYMGRIKELNEYLDKVRSIVKPGCSQDVVKAALSAMSSVTSILSVMSSNGSSA